MSKKIKHKKEIVPEKFNRCIVNLAVCSETSWYKAGQKRLVESLYEVGETEMFLATYENVTWKSAYEDKIAHIAHAAKYYRRLLWLDCSITAIKPLTEIWDYIEKNGYYLYGSGANCGETCNDISLKSYGLTRNEAALFPECASNVVGINLDHPDGKKFFDLWAGSLETGANLGHKWPTLTQRLGESLDARFKYHRQDQSTASLSAGKLGLKLEAEGHFVVRKENHEFLKNDLIIFVLKGGIGE